MGCNQPLLEPVQLLVIDRFTGLEMALKVKTLLLQGFEFIMECIALFLTKVAVHQISVEIGPLLFKIAQLLPKRSVV